MVQFELVYRKFGLGVLVGYQCVNLKEERVVWVQGRDLSFIYIFQSYYFIGCFEIMGQYDIFQRKIVDREEKMVGDSFLGFLLVQKFFKEERVKE